MQESSPSDTARLIAKSILLMSREPRLAKLVPTGEPELLRRILSETGSMVWFDRVIGNRLGRMAIFWMERFLLDGIQLHYLARKRWIEMKVREAIAGGISQVVVVGAGFDLLAWRLADGFPTVEFFEIDHPATQRPKWEVLKGKTNFHFITADLSRVSVRQALEGCAAFSFERPAASVAEGLTMYLEEEKVSNLLRELGEIGGELIFTFMRKSADGSIQFRNENPLVGWWLGRRQEPFKWGISREDLEGFLAGSSLKFLEFADHETLREVILAPLTIDHHSLARGECLCYCAPQ
jgi:methyltransferase (TIGR00027 family)